MLLTKNVIIVLLCAATVGISLILVLSSWQETGPSVPWLRLPSTSSGSNPSPGIDATTNNNNTSPAGLYPVAGHPGIDKFGIKENYPTAHNGRVWTSTWDNGISRTFGNSANDTSDPEFVTAGMGNASYRTAGDGILKISGSIPRMYIFNTTKDWHNVEITVYGMRVNDTNIDYGGIQAYARTNHGVVVRSEEGGVSSYLCDTRGYGAQLTYSGKFLFEKETAHGAGNGYPKVNAKSIWDAGMPKDQWIGYKFVVRDINGGKHVKLEAYIDTTNGLNGGAWTKVGEFTDNGSNFGVGYDACKSGVNPGLPLTSSNARAGSESGRPNVAVYFRSDGVGADGLLYKNASIREVDPLP